MGSQVLRTSSNNLKRLSRDNSTIRVGNRSSIGSSMSSQVLSTGSYNSGLISGHYSTIGVSNKGMVDISSNIRISSISSSILVTSIRESSIGKSSMRKDVAMSSQMGSSDSCYCRFISRDNSSIWIRDKLGRAHSNARGKNQKLHVDIGSVCASVET